MWHMIAYIFSVTVATFAIERTMRVFFEKRKTRLALVILAYLFFWVTFLVHLHEIADVLLHLLALLLISLTYESVATKRVAAVAVGHYLMLSVTDLNAVLTRFFGNEILAIVLSSLFVFLVTLLVFPLFRHIKKTTINLNRLWLPLIIFPILHTFIMLFRNVGGGLGVSVLIMFNISGAILIFLFLYNTLSKVVEDTLKSALHSKEKEYYFAQCRLMQESMEKVRAIRHDMKNHLAALKDYTVGNDAATEYLNDLLGEIEESETYSNTGNIAFDSIINFKLKNAKADNIALDLSVAVPSKMNVDVADIVTIFGNLLDNALEAVAKTSERIIKLDIEFGKGGLFAKVDNSFNGELKYLHGQAGAKRFASLKGGNEHGYGLSNIRNSVEKYDGYMKTTHTENVFSTVVFLYVT